MSFEYINQYYKVNADFGRNVTVGSRLGTITEDKGNYIGVTFHDDQKKQSLPCHPTSEVIYLDTFTDLKLVTPKNSKSKQRYLHYLESEYSGTFAEYLGIKKNKKY